MIIKQISIFVENKKGRMAEITKIMADAGIDIRALSLADTTDFGILRLIVDAPDKAVEALRAADVTVSLTDVVAVGLDDAPGSFAKVVGVLADADINLEYMYAFVSRNQGKAYVILRIENVQAGIDALQAKGIQVMSNGEIYNM